jgi:hypothetical protein
MDDNKLLEAEHIRQEINLAHIPREPRRPHSGPSHGYGSQPGPPHPRPYSGRREPGDLMVKRDPSDEPSRPQYKEPGGPHHRLPPFEHPGDPAPYQTISYPPTQSSMYGHLSLPPPTRDPYASVSCPSRAAPGVQDGKRKMQRAAQACDSCRTLKAKCDEGRPFCSSCREKGIDCCYQDPPPKQYVV